MNSLIQLKKTTPLLLIAFVLACLALSPRAQAAPNNNASYGKGALPGNTMGDFNSAFGVDALEVNSTGNQNTAIGVEALHHNTTGNNNTANGVQALDANTIGTQNTAVGYQALGANTTGTQNTAVGERALLQDTTGSQNVAVGPFAGFNVSTASNVICIGANVMGDDVSGSCFIGNIRGKQTQNADAIPVLIDSAGQLGTISSSARFKKEIEPMNKASESILALKPVTFHYKSDKRDTPQFGLIAEEVAKVNPDLVVHDRNGEIYTVRYDAVNAMLLNEFLKEHRKNQEQEATIAKQQKQIDALRTGLEKVSAQLELSKPAPQTVLNDQ